MTAGSAAPTSAPAGAVALHNLVSRTRVFAPGEVDDLLDVIGQDGFAWIRSGAGFVTAGVAARLPVNSGPGRLAEAADMVAEALQSITVDGPSPAGENCVPGAGPIAVGALPFDDRTTGSLVVPALIVTRRADGSGWLTTIGPADGRDTGVPSSAANGHHVATPGSESGRTAKVMNGHRATPGPGADVALHEAPGRAEWTNSVRRILATIDAGEVRKVVLARELVVEADGQFDRRVILDRLRRSHPSCFTYAAGDFVGASPELLIRRRGTEVSSCPMAGTVRRGDTPEEDEALVAGLRRSVKEAEEHRLLVESVVSALGPVCAGPPTAGEPDVIRFPTVSHLATRVSGVLRDPVPSALALAGRLHPTPAVGGLPRPEALAAIADLEGFDRGLYAGPVGWVDANGDGEWAVALRGAQLDGPRARLVAGAGIVAGSDPDAEWAETEAKLRPMLAAVGALPG